MATREGAMTTSAAETGLIVHDSQDCALLNRLLLVYVGEKYRFRRSSYAGVEQFHFGDVTMSDSARSGESIPHGTLVVHNWGADVESTVGPGSEGVAVATIQAVKTSVLS
jgi:hypothetical protein